MTESQLPTDVRTVQWSPGGPTIAGAGAKVASASIGACDACRARKVRCLASENAMSNKCQRCARAGRECVYTVHSKTRRRKRTDTRVKELEEKVKNLSVLLEQGRQNTKGTVNPSKQSNLEPDDGMDEESDEVSDEDDEEEGEDDEAQDSDDEIESEGVGKAWQQDANSSVKGKVKPMTNPGEPQRCGISRRSKTGTAGNDSLDVIDRNLISMKEATDLFDHYVNVLSPNYPAVVFPPGTTAAEVRANRPILFLSVIAAAASASDPNVNLKLNQEILQLYATKVALEGQKNLDLVQSILISSLWYYPPERFDQLKFHQYIHMAATMALDLGIGKRPRTRRQQTRRQASVVPDYEPEKLVGREITMATPVASAPDSSAIESRRTLLACYLQCASVSMSLRLPNALRFTSFMGECIDVLETSPDAAPTDKRFVAWVKLQRIVEESVNSFALDDPESTVSLDDHRSQKQLRGFEAQLKVWRDTLPAGVLNSFLESNYLANNIYIHEIALHPDHEPEDFRPPYYVATQLTSKIPAQENPIYGQAIMECVESAQAYLKVFLAMDLTLVRALPALVFVRAVYSSIILIKLEISSGAPNSELGQMLDGESLGLSATFQKLLRHQIAIVGKNGRNITAAKFLMIMKKLIAWYHTYKAQLEYIRNKQNVDGKIGTSDYPHPRIQSSTNSLQNQESYVPIPLGDISDLSKIPQSFLQPFSGISQPMSASNSGTESKVSQVSLGVATDISSAIRSNSETAQIQQAAYDYHQAMLASQQQSENSPSADYSSPEHYGSTGHTDSEMSPPMAYGKMIIDPGMFGQLQNICEPYAYNPDPNDWLFDNTMDLNNLGMTDANVMGMSDVDGVNLLDHHRSMDGSGMVIDGAGMHMDAFKANHWGQPQGT